MEAVPTDQEPLVFELSPPPQITYSFELTRRIEDNVERLYTHTIIQSIGWMEQVDSRILKPAWQNIVPDNCLLDDLWTIVFSFFDRRQTIINYERQEQSLDRFSERLSRLTFS